MIDRLAGRRNRQTIEVLSSREQKGTGKTKQEPGAEQGRKIGPSPRGTVDTKSADRPVYGGFGNVGRLSSVR